MSALNEAFGYSYNTLTETLKNAGIGDPDTCRYEAGILLEHFCGVHRAMLPIRRDEVFRSEKLVNAVARRIAHYPLQYLVGEWQFCTETYRVTPDCLIPRMDTEILVEAAHELLPRGGRFIDLCTGSGCVAISLLAARIDARGVAVELYPNTLEIAIENAARNRVADRLAFHRADVLTPECFMDPLGRFDLILSNPPYIPSAVVDGLSEEVRNEPRAALDGGEDGLTFYRVLISEYPKYLSEGGRLIFEIGYDQAEAVTALASAAGMTAQIRKDLGGNDRVAVISR